jgi:hypothetical protein
MLQKMVKICPFRKPMIKIMLFLMMLSPALSFSQGKPDKIKRSPDFWIGAGYAFYPGSSADVKLGLAGNNPLKSGFTAEFSAEKQLNSFLYVGAGASLFSYKDLNNPYIPVFADIRVIGAGTFKLYSFLDPGYGFYQNSYYYPLIDPAVKVRERGGFFIAYGVGVTYKKVYLQAKYNWLRFSGQSAATGKSSKGYGVAGISFGVRLR